MFAKTLAALSPLLFCVAAHAAAITGAGSSAAQPLYAKWSEAYSRSGGVPLSYQPVGSSAGVKQVKEKTVDFGASDVALSPDDAKKSQLVCFPSAISGVVPVVNLAGVRAGELQLTGELLADIFARRITRWNDPALVALNPSLAGRKAPIVTLARSDGSGTTYNFTDYLGRVSPAWKQSYGTNFTVAWPADTVLLKGSSGIVTGLKRTEGAIGYVDYNYVLQDKLAYARMRNRDGRMVAPDAEGFATALNNSAWKSEARFEEMLTDRPGAKSWPITMGTFVIVPQVASNPAQTLAALKFFTWAFVNGERIADGGSFVHLPDSVQARIYADLTRITDRSGVPLQWSLTDVLQLSR
jgi:phosphate transport system substrate-binding protein